MSARGHSTTQARIRRLCAGAALLTACARTGFGDTGEPTEVAQLASAGAQTCALRRDGQVRCWGAPGGVASPPGPTATRLARATPVAGLTDAVEIAVAAGHACARRTGGSVVCWGDDALGQLGDGGTSASATPVAVVGLHDATQVSAMSSFTCARRATGRVVCWGENVFGVLGAGTTAGSSNTPVEVPGIDDAEEVSAGEFAVCARRRGGAVVCWGRALAGQLGDGATHAPCLPMGTEACSATPVSVSGLSDAVQISAGLNLACARRATGAVVCWGWGSSGAIGDGGMTDRPTPVPVVGLTDAVSVHAMYLRVCALRASGALACWGFNDLGILGDGTTTSRAVPTEATDVGGDALEVAGGWEHTCVRTGGTTVLCWGNNEWNQLGDGTTTLREHPGVVLGL